MRENNVAILPKRVVLIERFLARAPVSLIDFLAQSLKTLTFLWNVLVFFS